MCGFNKLPLGKHAMMPLEQQTARVIELNDPTVLATVAAMVHPEFGEAQPPEPRRVADVWPEDQTSAASKVNQAPRATPTRIQLLEMPVA
jgi:hypothetical protein